MTTDTQHQDHAVPPAQPPNILTAVAFKVFTAVTILNNVLLG
jgi:hypothetical protein